MDCLWLGLPPSGCHLILTCPASWWAQGLVLHLSEDSGRNDYMTLRSKVSLGLKVHLEVRRKPRRKGVTLEDMAINETRTKGEKKFNEEGKRDKGWVLFITFPGGPLPYLKWTEEREGMDRAGMETGGRTHLQRPNLKTDRVFRSGTEVSIKNTSWSKEEDLGCHTRPWA